MIQIFLSTWARL